VQKAAPDGQVLLYTFAVHVQLRIFIKTAPWDAFRISTPITTGAKIGDGADGAHRAPFNTVKELVAYRRRPGQAELRLVRHRHYAISNGELFKKLAGIDLVHVAYKGSGDAMKDHLSGAVQLFLRRADHGDLERQRAAG